MLKVIVKGEFKYLISHLFLVTRLWLRARCLHYRCNRLWFLANLQHQKVPRKERWYKCKLDMRWLCEIKIIQWSHCWPLLERQQLTETPSSCAVDLYKVLSTCLWTNSSAYLKSPTFTAAQRKNKGKYILLFHQGSRSLGCIHSFCRMQTESIQAKQLTLLFPTRIPFHCPYSADNSWQCGFNRVHVCFS